MPDRNDEVTPTTVLASATAGVIGRLLCHPIDTIKSKIQASDRVAGIKDAVLGTWKKEGLSGFYRGLGIVMAGTVPGNAIYLTAYEATKLKLLKTDALQGNPFAVYLLSGLTAEIACCGIFLPVDVIKERLQVQDLRSDYNYKGSVDAFRTIVREEGVRGLYKGYTATIYSFGPFSAVYFALYEKFKLWTSSSKQLEDQESNFFLNTISSALAGACASFVTNPLEIGKIRYQTQKSLVSPSVVVANGTVSATTATIQAEENYRSMWHATRSVYQRLGIFGLFRGAGTRILFHTPSTAITMASYEECKRLWKFVL